MVADSNCSGDNPDVFHVEPSTIAFFGSKSLGAGTLRIDESFVCWEANNDENKFCLGYPSISLHAISRDTSSFEHECVLCLFEGNLLVEEGEDADITEVRFVPQDKNSLQKIYDSITLGQSKHPDPEDEESEDENEWFGLENMDEVELSEQGQAVLDRLRQGVQMPTQDEFVSMIGGQNNGNSVDAAMETEDGQFDDADYADQ